MEHWIWYIYVGVLGGSLGSCITMLVHRMHQNLPLLNDRSRCPACNRVLQWFELIPVMSFLFLQGKCRKCKHIIPARYILIEVVSTVLFIFAWNHAVHSGIFSWLALIRDWVIIFVSVFTFAYDALYMEVSPNITLGGGIIIAALTVCCSTPGEWKSLVLGMLVGIAWFGIQFIISKGKWIGGGDIFIGFFMGASLGFGKLIVGLGIAYVIGACVGISLLALGKKERHDQIAFGTFLTIGTLAALWWGDAILSWYGYILG